MVDVNELVKIVVAIVFGVLVIVAFFVYGKEGLIGKVKEAVLGAKEVLPKVSVGLEEQKAEVTIPDVHREQIENLQKSITLILSGKDRGVANNNCFAEYGGFSDLGEEGTSLTFDLSGEKTLLMVHGGAGGEQVIYDFSAEFPGMKPCVIAGDGGVSEHFYNHFIVGKEDLVYPYFKEVHSLRIFSDGSRNQISVGEFNLQNNLEDGGWLFTPDGEHICFFPTNAVSDYSDTGIDNNYFVKDRLYSIPYNIQQGTLQQCS